MGLPTFQVEICSLTRTRLVTDGSSDQPAFRPSPDQTLGRWRRQRGSSCSILHQLLDQLNGLKSLRGRDPIGDDRLIVELILGKYNHGHPSDKAVLENEVH